MIEMIRCNFDRETAISILAGLIVIFLSICMTFFPNNEFASILLRDVLMILILGFIFPLYYIKIIKRKSISVFGIHKKKLGISFLINIIASIFLLAKFYSEKQTTIIFNKNTFFAISYIFVAGIFEMTFFYGFLRYEFERAFGIFISIILTSAFYSLHHAGFQPEFLKLFFVGILYSTTFYSAHNIFVIYPFFWGVGAVWDVLVNSNAGNSIRNVDSFIVAIVLLMIMIAISFIIFKNDHLRRKV